MKHTKLNNGLVMPMLGIGTYKMDGTDLDVYNSIRSALDVGYRHIDTATFYNNEAAIGQAIRDSRIAREDLFVTTKVWATDIIKGNIHNAFDLSLKILNIDYIDLYLVHWPVKGQVVETWLDMEKVHATGNTKSIGVSNHLQHHLESILEVASIKPVANQVELHPYLSLNDLVSFCEDNEIVVQAWSPLVGSRLPLLEEKILEDIGNKYKKTPAQVALRWHIQRGVVAIPKSAKKERQESNIDIFDFELSEEDMKNINSLNTNSRTGIHPDEIKF